MWLRDGQAGTSVYSAVICLVSMYTQMHAQRALSVIRDLVYFDSLIAGESGRVGYMPTTARYMNNRSRDCCCGPSPFRKSRS